MNNFSMNGTHRIFYVFALVAGMLAAGCTQAGLFDDPKNLKVLPEDISTNELRDTMRGFSFATGLRCKDCHVGEGDDLESFDFPADDKKTKKTARVMFKMVQDINARLAKELGPLQEDSMSLVEVRCISCHRGQRKPRMLEDVLADTFSEKGLEGASARYRELRGEYYGSHTFDFSPAVLVRVAEGLFRQQHPDDALAILDLNLEFNPTSVMSYVMQGQILARTGRKDGARVALGKALEVEPDGDWIRQMLDRL